MFYLFSGKISGERLKEKDKKPGEPLLFFVSAG